MPPECEMCVGSYFVHSLVKFCAFRASSKQLFLTDFEESQCLQSQSVRVLESTPRRSIGARCHRSLLKKASQASPVLTHEQVGVVGLCFPLLTCHPLNTAAGFLCLVTVEMTAWLAMAGSSQRNTCCVTCKKPQCFHQSEKHHHHGQLMMT